MLNNSDGSSERYHAARENCVLCALFACACFAVFSPIPLAFGIKGMVEKTEPQDLYDVLTAFGGLFFFICLCVGGNLLCDGYRMREAAAGTTETAASKQRLLINGKTGQGQGAGSVLVPVAEGGGTPALHS